MHFFPLKILYRFLPHRIVWRSLEYFFHNLPSKFLVCLMQWKIVINIFINPTPSPKIKVTVNLVIHLLPATEDRNIKELWELCSDLTVSLKDIELLCQECAFWELWREIFFLTYRHALDWNRISAVTLMAAKYDRFKVRYLTGNATKVVYLWYLDGLYFGVFQFNEFASELKCIKHIYWWLYRLQMPLTQSALKVIIYDYTGYIKLWGCRASPLESL